MSKRARPFRPRWQRHNPLIVATNAAGKLTPTERAQLLRGPQSALQALREGIATERQWAELASAMNIAESIEKQGIVRGLGPHLVAAHAALATIANRARARGAWQPTSLYFDELDDVRTGVELFDFQLRELSYGEYRRALEHAIAVVQSAGGQVVREEAVMP